MGKGCLSLNDSEYKSIIRGYLIEDKTDDNRAKFGPPFLASCFWPVILCK